MGVALPPGLFLLGLVNGVLLLNTCEKQKTCGECIREPALCVWCAMENFNGTRCKSAKSYNEDWCPTLLQNPINKKSVAAPDNIDFSSDPGRVTQLKPQRYKIDLRPGVPINFTFSFRPATDYPVDLYFLLDTSITMENVRKIIEEQSENIYDTMKNLTSNIQLGMGSFIDKNTLPFTDIIDSKKTYSFRNRLNLTNDIDLFKKTIKETDYGRNFDEPEGGLDALAQVISCKDQIGWRNESRKIIVFLTDAPYHVAGDGMIGGIFTPYDGGCYTNIDGVYAKELEMDYPSVSIINKMAADEEITIIFAVKSRVQALYSHLSEAISGSKCETYDGGHNNIAKLLTNIYEDITTTIKLKVNVKTGHRDKFNIVFSPDCTADNNPNCTVKKDEEKEFTGAIAVLEDYNSDNTSIDIVIKGIKEKLTLDVNFIKDCECANNMKLNSSECSDSGTLKCGICECNKNRYGDRCACAANGAPRVNDNSTCIMPGDEFLCHGHGSCFCGACVCRKDSPYEGKYCQFNKDNCPRYNNTVCNGHGRCEGEKCVCTDDFWTGEACECPKMNKSCMGSNEKICNNMGICQCGKCYCELTASWDARENLDVFCNILPCPDCHKPQCDLLQPCARCLQSGRECLECKPFKASVSKDPISPVNVSWNVCPDIAFEVGCYTRYMYRYSENEYNIELVVQGDKNCLESYYMYGGVCLGSLILIGLATLVAWKWLTDVQDRREYERFLREHQEDFSAVCQNPTYRPASTTITNPAFRKPSVDFRL